LKGLIISNGNIKDLNWLRKIGREFDFILCADGGCNYCIEAGILPDLVIGDLDSILPKTLNVIHKSKVPIKKFPTKKNATDTELALEFLMNKGIKDITLVGVLGSRIDHSLANILLLKKLQDKGVKGKIIDENNTIYLVDEELILDKKEGFYVSIIPLIKEGINISLKGFEYELNESYIEFGSTLGISNNIVSEKGYIKVNEGMCLVCISKD